MARATGSDADRLPKTIVTVHGLGGIRRGQTLDG